MSAKIRILYIDDYELDRELVKDALEREHGGFELMEASNKQEFETLLKTHAFDLVLSDFNIAGFEGLQVLEAVQAHYPQIPVIIVTGTGSEEIAAKALKQGAADYVIKRPKHIRRLPQTILSVIEKQKFRYQRQQAETALKESEEKFRNISENSLVGIYIIQDGIFLYANPKFAEIFGYSVEECLNRMHFRQLVFSEDFDTVQEQVSKRASGGSKFVQYAFRGVKKDGKIIHVEIFGSSVVLNGKRAVTGTMLDITERKRAEEALKNERDLIERIMGTSPAGITRVDASGAVIYANHLAEELLGIELSAVKGRTYNDPDWKITDLEGKPFPEEKLPFAIVKKTFKPVFDVQHAIEWPNGKRILLCINAAPFINSGGQFDGMVATIEDITEKHRVEQNYQMLFREMLDGFALHEIICNKQGRPIDYRYLNANPAFERLTGLNSEMVIGKTVLEVMPQTESYWIEKYGQVALTGEPISFEGYSQALERYFHVSAFRPAPKQFAAIFMDITNRKKSEEALHQAHNRFLTVLDSIDATIYVADMRTHEVLFMNKCMKDAFGRDMTGEVCWNVFRGESGPCRCCTNNQLTDENGKPTGVHVWQDRNPITRKWYINYDRAIEWTDGRLVRLQIATDITELKILEERLRQGQKMESIGQLAGGIAHDFNNLLSSIIGFTELSLDEVSKETSLEDNLQEVYTAGKRARDLVKQILAFARQSDEERKPLQPDTITKEVLKFIRSTIPTSIEIEHNLESQSLILGNPTHIHQILMNLCTNAAQAMEDTGGILKVELKDVAIDNKSSLKQTDLKHGSYLRITVSDTGYGIGPDIINSIFDPYFTTKGPGEGTGMGLALTHGIIESYGGKIFVDSEPGKGTTFSVYLPITKKHEDHEPYEKVGSPSGTERILFIDDELPIVKMGSQLLERLGYTVTIRTSSVEALELFQAKPNEFDLVITDMTMPNLTGEKLAIELMKIRSDIPVILCTGYSKKIADEIALEIGIKAFAYKPIVKSDLAKTIRKVLDEAKGQPNS